MPGTGCPIDDWTEITTALADKCRVLAFNRAGCGASDPNPRGSSVLNTVADLHSVLSSFQIQAPVILVGHSYGGLCVQRFAREYPNSVCGVVLVDSSSVEMDRLDSLTLPELNEQQSDKEWLEQCRQFASMTPAEILQQNDSLLTPYQLKFPHELIERITEFYTNPNLYKTMIQEVEVWHKCTKETKESGAFADVPLKVLARDPQHCIRLLTDDGIPASEAELFENVWHDLIVEQTRLSKQGELVTALNATHVIYEHRPDVIIQAINELVKLCFGSTEA